MGNNGLRFTVRNDYAFKKMFGREENKEILRRFLSLVLEIKEESITDIIYKHTFVGGRFEEDKHGVIDIKLELNKDTIINIEMQNIWHPYYEERVMFGWANSYVEEIHKGQNYSKLKKCVSINVLNSKFPYSDEIHSVYKILNIKDYKPFKDILELHFLDLTLLNKEIDNLNELEKWLLFIETDSEALRETLSREDKVMEKANVMMKEFYSDPKERALYLAEFKDACDRTTIYENGLFEGEKRGIAIGEKLGESRGIAIGESRGIRLIAVNMKNQGFSTDIIIKTTGLSKEEIELL